VLAKLLQDIKLLVALEDKALENERGFSPWPVKFGDIDAKRQFIDGNFPEFHAAILYGWKK
jgi:hypothetical protein